MSDISDRNTVILVFIFAYIYINYIRIKINIKTDWHNLKCNPLNLWMGSFYKDATASNNDLKNCIDVMSAKSINLGLETAFKKQTSMMNDIEKKETELNEYANTIDENINGTNGLISKYDDNEEVLNDINDKQNSYNTINNTLATNNSSNPLYNFTSSINDIFTKINTFLPKYTN